MAIENLKKPVKFLADSWKQYNISKEGGFQGKEVFDFIPALMQLPGIFSSTDEMSTEWKARTKEDIVALATYAKTASGETSEEFSAIVDVVAAALILQLAFRKEVVALPPVTPP